MDFKNYINKKVLDNIKELRREFQKGKPYKHVIVRNFLKKEKAIALLRELQKEKFIEKESDLFSFKQTDDLHFAKSKKIKDFHKSFLSWDFFGLIEKITGIKLRGTLDMAGTLYEDGDFLLCHDDELEGRKIAYVLYLSSGFSEKDGGSFVLFNSKNGKPNEVAQK